MIGLGLPLLKDCLLAMQKSLGFIPRTAQTWHSDAFL